MTRRTWALVAAMALGLVGVSVPGSSQAGPRPEQPRPAAQVAPGPAGLYRAVSTSRTADSRRPLDERYRIPAGGSRAVYVTNGSAVPVEAPTVVLNVTVVPNASGVMTIYPTGQPKPATSNLNYVAGRPVANQVVVALGTDRRVTFTNSATKSADIIVDVQGYFEASEPVPGAVRLVDPARVLDTRTRLGGSTPGAGKTLDLQVTGRGGIPTDNVSAVLLNVTAAKPQARGELRLRPAGVDKTATTFLSFNAGATVPNFTIAKLGRGGRLSIDNLSAGATPLVADVVGYVVGGVPAVRGAYLALTQRRIDQRFEPTGPRQVRQPDLRAVAEPGVIRRDAEAYALTVTATRSTEPSFLAVGASSLPPETSTLQHRPGLRASGSAFAEIVNVYNRAGSVELLIDLNGFFLGRDGAAGVAVVTGRITGEGGGPLAGAYVALYTADEIGNDDPNSRSTRTDADGWYRFDDIGTAGDYVVCAEPPTTTANFRAECYENVLFNGESPSQGSTVVPVNVGEESTVSWELDRR